MKVVVIKKADLGVTIIHPAYDVYGDSEGKLPYAELPALKGIDSKDWFLLDKAALPSKEGLESRRQLYWEGKAVKVDHKWDKRLMHPDLLMRKHRNRLSQKLEDELGKATPDTLKLIRAQLDHSTLKDWTELDHYEQALENLDEKVANGEPDKPDVRKRLKDKIKELK